MCVLRKVRECVFVFLFLVDVTHSNFIFLSKVICHERTVEKRKELLRYIHYKELFVLKVVG